MPALVCLHLYIVGSMVHLTWFYSHFTSLSLSLYHSYNLISSAIRPSIVQWCLRMNLHRVFALAWLALYKSPHSSSLLFSRLISYVIIFCHTHSMLWGNRYRYRSSTIIHPYPYWVTHNNLRFGSALQHWSSRLAICSGGSLEAIASEQIYLLKLMPYITYCILI